MHILNNAALQTAVEMRGNLQNSVHRLTSRYSAVTLTPSVSITSKQIISSLDMCQPYLTALSPFPSLSTRHATWRFCCHATGTWVCSTCVCRKHSGSWDANLFERRVYMLGSSSGKGPPASLPEMDTSPDSCHCCLLAACAVLAVWPSRLNRRLKRPPAKHHFFPFCTFTS